MITEQTIWKYELEITDGQNISIPKGGSILTIQTQNEKPCLWVLVNPKVETEIRFFEMYGTGNPIISDIGSSRNYIGTFQILQGHAVFHVFEYTGV